jgi:hypothetical protein
MPIRSQTYDVDASLMLQGKLYSESNGTVYAYLEYYDPAKGFIPSEARKNLDRISIYDPASYNTGNVEIYPLNATRSWGPEHIGETWWNLASVRYYDYEISDNAYRWQNWGQIAPGTSVDVYEWVESPVAPDMWATYVASGTSFVQYGYNYTPTGFVLNSSDPAYTTLTEYNAANQPITRYYFWVANATTLPLPPNRAVTTLQISNLIKSPTSYGVRWYAAIDSRTILVSGVGKYLSGNDTVLSLLYTHQENNQVDYKQYDLLRPNDPASLPSDFFWTKLKDSLTGKDGQDENVPDPYLSDIMRYGTLIRPRQSWFKYRTVAAETYVAEANKLLGTILLVPDINRSNWIKYFDTAEAPPSADYTVGTISSRNALAGIILTGSTVLVLGGADTNNLWKLYQYQYNGGNYIWTELSVQAYNTPNYWYYVDWYLVDSGVTSLTIPKYVVQTENEKDQYAGVNGTLVKVLNRGDGYWAMYKWVGSTLGAWVTVGYQNGTIQISTGVYDGSLNTMLFGTTPFDSTGFDIFPHVEFASMIDGLVYAIFDNPNPAIPGESVYLNQLFFAMINYVLVEQGFVDWLFKTSFIYLRGFKLPLSTSQLYQPDYSDALLAYLNEVKPYHAKVRAFVTQRTWQDNATVYTTDFDNEATGNTSNLAWQQNYQNNPDLIRTLKISLLFDRIASNSVGWDSKTWSVKGWEFENNTYGQPTWGAFTRIRDFYAPTADMIRKDDPNLIPNSDYRGIIMDALGFRFGPGWDYMPWDSPTGFDANQSSFNNYIDVIVQGGVAPVYDKFYGTGTKRTFQLSNIPQSPQTPVVWSDGVLRQYGVDWVIPNWVTGLLLANGGSGYAIGDKLYLAIEPSVAPSTLTVLEVDVNGAILSVALDSSGSYDLFPNGPVRVEYQPYTSGTGIDAMFQPIWGGSTLVFYDAPLSNAAPNVFVLYVGTTFVPAPTGPIDIINDGNQFIQPYVDEDHPEELYKFQIPSSLRIDTYQQASGGSPVIYMRIFKPDGVRDHFPLGIQPMDQSAVIAQLDGRMLTYGLEYDYVINWASNTLVFMEPPVGTSLQLLTISVGGTGTGMQTVVPVSAGIGYQPGDIVTLAGGQSVNYDSARIQVLTVQAVNVAIVSGGIGYSIGDILILANDYQSSETYPVQLTVSNVAVNTGSITAVNLVQLGQYTFTPETFSYETSGSGSGANIAVAWGIDTISVAAPGIYSVRPTQPIAQYSTSGTGTGASFNALFDHQVSQNTFVGDGVNTDFVIASAVPNNDANLLFVTQDGLVLNSSNSDITVNGRVITITPTPSANSTISITLFESTNFSIVQDQEIQLQTGVYVYQLTSPPISTMPPYISTTVAKDGSYLRGPNMDIYLADGYTNSFYAAYVPANLSYLLVYAGDYLQTYLTDYIISGNEILFFVSPVADALVSIVLVDPNIGYDYQIINNYIEFQVSPPIGWGSGAWNNYYGWSPLDPRPTSGQYLKFISYSQDVSYDFRAQSLPGPCYPIVPGNTNGTFVLIDQPYDDSTLMVWINGTMQTLLYDYRLSTVSSVPGWDITGYNIYGWNTEYSGEKAIVFAPNVVVESGDLVTAQYMSALPERAAIAWRTILSDAYQTSTAIADANKTFTLNDVTVYSTSIEVADITVLPQPTATLPGTVWIGDERIDYWIVSEAPTTNLPNRGFLEQLIRGTFNTPVGNVSVLYDTIFYDGDGITTLFPTASGTQPAGGNVVVSIGSAVQVDTAINPEVGTFTIVDNPPGEPAGVYVSFVDPPVVGWRNIRLASPRLEVQINSPISHPIGSTVISAGDQQTIQGGYNWISAPHGLQYSSSTLAQFLLEHPGTRT